MQRGREGIPAAPPLPQGKSLNIQGSAASSSSSSSSSARPSASVRQKQQLNFKVGVASSSAGTSLPRRAMSLHDLLRRGARTEDGRYFPSLLLNCSAVLRCPLLHAFIVSLPAGCCYCIYVLVFLLSGMSLHWKMSPNGGEARHWPRPKILSIQVQYLWLDGGPRPQEGNRGGRSRQHCGSNREKEVKQTIRRLFYITLNPYNNNFEICIGLAVSTAMGKKKQNELLDLIQGAYGLEQKSAFVWLSTCTPWTGRSFTRPSRHFFLSPVPVARKRNSLGRHDLSRTEELRGRFTDSIGENDSPECNLIRCFPSIHRTAFFISFRTSEDIEAILELENDRS